MTDTLTSELPDDVDFSGLTRADVDRIEGNRSDEAEFHGWRVFFNEAQGPDALWSLQVRYIQSGAGRMDPDLPSKPPVPSMDQPDPPPPGPPSRFISARRTLPTTVVYIDADGRDVIREGGSRSWRNCNPGNVRRGDFALSNGAIGDDNAFAIFPDEANGFNAIVALLTSPSYRSLSLHDAIFKYAPPTENDSAAYVKAITTGTGIAADAVLAALPIARVRAICTVIKQFEGWKVGVERPNQPNSVAHLPDSGSGMSAAVGAARDWLDIAQREAALPEHERSSWAGPAENPRIIEYFRVAAPWFEPVAGDETDWCAAFVNYCLVLSGHVGTDHPGARSFFWNRKQQFVRLDRPVRGAIAVRRYAPFDDPSWKDGPGHVAFVLGFGFSSLMLLGGNQGRSVNVTSFPLIVDDAHGKPSARFVAYMMPVMT